MKLTRLEVKSFRNLKELQLNAADGVNVIYGENGQGKTNLLEAIWLFTGSKASAALPPPSLFHWEGTEPTFRFAMTTVFAKTSLE